jgi:arsenate reductase
MTLTIHGIKACDTMKKAFAWLDAKGVAYDFHDYKKLGIEAAVVKGWAGQVGWEALVNRQGTTFRKLPESDTQGLDEPRAIRLMVAHNSVIRRPVLVRDGKVVAVGFKPESYQALFG